MSWAEIVAFSIGGALLLLMTLGVAFSFFAPGLDRWHRRYLSVLFALQFVSVAISFVDAILYSDATMANAERVVYVFGFIFLLPLTAMPTLFLLHQSGVSFRKSLLFKIALGLGAVYVGLFVAAQFGDAFYEVAPNNRFERGPLFPLLVAPLALMTLCNAIAAILLREKLKKRFFISSMVYLPPLLGTLLVHAFVPIEFFVLLGLGLWALTILGLVFQEGVEEHMRQQKEIADQRASILVLQMRPHFIYNTMTSIYYLCDQDPAKAKKVTLDFTTYLRKNFAAIASETNVPFTNELEHTQAYLAVEQAQFEDALFVTFDTPHTLFRLPPLTLQPIVENAVKHGMRESKAPIHILVRTQKTDKASEIIVEDDGPGFGQTDNNDPHIALGNIRQRLEMTCKGRLDISPREGGGTRVKIVIPLESENAAGKPSA